MFYITYTKQEPRSMYQISIDDIFNGTVNEEQIKEVPYTTERPASITVERLKLDDLPECSQETIDNLLDLKRRLQQAQSGDYSDSYQTFKIPKKTGGLREICAPKPALKETQSKIKNALERCTMGNVHNAAHAYVKGRSTVTAIQEHQKNNSRWFLKVDIKNFFGSFNKNFIQKQLNQVYPFCVAYFPSWKVALKDGVLPQGTPISPILTNICMVPLDTQITKMLGKDYVYTRYADDILISNKYNFDWRKIVENLKRILEDTPLEIKPEKTRYGSSAGRNWNLGLMLNKDNNITIGHRAKETFRACVFSFLKDYATGTYWSLEDVHHLQGLLSYYQHIEPTHTETLIKKYETKTNINLKDSINSILTGNGLLLST